MDKKVYYTIVLKKPHKPEGETPLWCPEGCGKWLGGDTYIAACHAERHTDNTISLCTLSCPTCNIDLVGLEGLRKHYAASKRCHREVVKIYQTASQPYPTKNLRSRTINSK